MAQVDGTSRTPEAPLVPVGVLMAGTLLLSGGATWLLGGTWAVPVWAAGSAACTWLGARSGQKATQWAGLLLLVPVFARLLLWETWPGLFGGVMASPYVLVLLFLAGAGATWAAARKVERFAVPLLAATNLLAFWGLTLGVTRAFDGAHNGRVAGHEGLAVAGVWALYGLAMALVERRRPQRLLRLGARGVLGAAASFLVLGALMANARWAFVPYRVFAYTAVLGSAWLSEYLFRHHPEDGDVHGLLSLTVTGLGVWIGSFEVVRWLEPAFTLPEGNIPTRAMLLWQRSMLTHGTAAVWALYGTAVMAAGVWVRSAQTRLLGLGIVGLAAGYLAVAGLPNPAATLWVRMVAYLAALGGGVLSAYWFWKKR